MVAQKKRLKLTVRPSAVSPAFLPYLRSQARHLLLWGGRDSTKSDFVALKLLLDAMQSPYFCCILIREKQNTIADSQIATLKKVATREGLLPYFRFPQGPSAVLEVRCLLNENKFIGRGTDDMDRVKSVSDPTCVWYEEANQIDGADAEVVSTTLRTSRAGAVIQEIYTFNPDHGGDYTQFWLYKKFFSGTGNAHGHTFGGRLAVDVNGQLVQVPYQVVHSTYHNNPWCPPERAATYEKYGIIDPDTGEMADAYRYEVWCKGNWATKRTGNEFYHKFLEKRIASAPINYLPGANIVQSWDANSLPYCAMLCGQTERTATVTTLRIFKEYALRSPNSGFRSTGQQFLKDRQPLGYAQSSVYLTGDASMRNNKIGEQRGESPFKDVQAALQGFVDADGTRVPGCLRVDSADFWPRKNPGVDRRRDFINDLFEGKIAGCAVAIDPGCKLLINDLKQVQKGIDGKIKKRVYDADLDASYEEIGHMSDVFDYICCTLFKAEYEAYRAGR